ncbi:MAG: AAA family ATPase [Candidatus Competibacteraceae bacterium]
MKIEHLYLKAFGAFSERRLDFTGGPDFHVIYGPNEAGKSTTLRALIGLLFGIEERTADDFVHSKPNLRIGAALATADAGRLAIMRRKGASKPCSRWTRSVARNRPAAGRGHADPAVGRSR